MLQSKIRSIGGHTDESVQTPTKRGSAPPPYLPSQPPTKRGFKPPATLESPESTEQFQLIQMLSQLRRSVSSVNSSDAGTRGLSIRIFFVTFCASWWLNLHVSKEPIGFTANASMVFFRSSHKVEFF